MRRKKLTFICILIFVIIFLIPLVNKVLYGTWNVMNYPKRIGLFGRNYYQKTLNIEVLKGNKKPKYEVSTLINTLTGKVIYISEYKEVDSDPSAIYLKVGKDKYLMLVLEGGP